MESWCSTVHHSNYRQFAILSRLTATFLKRQLSYDQACNIIPLCGCGGPRRPAVQNYGTLDTMTIEFKGEIWYWRGPAPWYFVTVPAKQSRDLQEIMGSVTYGWGMIPATIRIGDSEWKSALWPK